VNLASINFNELDASKPAMRVVLEECRPSSLLEENKPQTRQLLPKYNSPHKTTGSNRNQETAHMRHSADILTQASGRNILFFFFNDSCHLFLRQFAGGQDVRCGNGLRRL